MKKKTEKSRQWDCSSVGLQLFPLQASELRTALAVTLLQANAASPSVSSSEGDVGEEHDQVPESLKTFVGFSASV